MKTKRHLLLPVLLIVMLAIPTFTAFAKELGMLTITGPGIKGELSLNDHEAMMNLEQAGFFSSASLSKPPHGLDLKMGYNITAHLNLDGKLVPFVQMVYYPTNEGQAAYVHYIGRLEGESLRTVDEWGLLNRNADGILRDLMTANNVALQSALVAGSVDAEAPASSAAEPVAAVQPVKEEPAAAPVAAPVPNSATYIIPAIAAIFVLMVGAGLLIRRRTISQTTT